MIARICGKKEKRERKREGERAKKKQRETKFSGMHYKLETQCCAEYRIRALEY